ncbi:hypothetical protein PR048_004369 [Dryococelus australis]|uniref:Uncharacterized protein n=1 Tax=Dryococelus australis TaxID=614101 RepID=A0ABQ9I599_9NEOP|nr:hypothetical protein PR048_004369 [Dryococelus australis]
MEQRRNEGVDDTGDPQENPPTSGIVRHDSRLQGSGVSRPGIEPGLCLVGSERPNRSATVALGKLVGSGLVVTDGKPTRRSSGRTGDEIRVGNASESDPAGVDAALTEASGRLILPSCPLAINTAAPAPEGPVTPDNAISKTRALPAAPFTCLRPTHRPEDIYPVVDGVGKGCGCKLVLAQCCTHSAHAAGTSNQSGAGRNGIHCGHPRESGEAPITHVL